MTILPNDENASTTRRQFLAATAASAAAIPSAKAATDKAPRPRPKPRYRRFVVLDNGGGKAVHEGFGMTLKKAIAGEIETYRGCEAADRRDGLSIDEFWRRIDDQTIWEDQRVVALLQPQPDGTVKVTRLDGKIPA
jgi:hypothetical protein